MVGVATIGVFEVFLIRQGASGMAMIMLIVVGTPVYVATVLTGLYLNKRESERRAGGK
jgi:hypothetical protein